MRRRSEAADRRQHCQAAGAPAAEGRSAVEGPALPQPWPLVPSGQGTCLFTPMITPSAWAGMMALSKLLVLLCHQILLSGRPSKLAISCSRLS
jgi:hypothetical protein